jgi:HSP20 family protein
MGASFGYLRVEMSESAAELKVEAELSGLDENDVELLLRDGELIIRGEKQSEKENQERRMSERYYGRFERRITLPAEGSGRDVQIGAPRSCCRVAQRKAVTLTRSASR